MTKKLKIFGLIALFSWLLLLNGCEFWWTSTTSNLPDNEVTSIVRSFAKQLKLKDSDITQETYYRYNYTDMDNVDNEIQWYGIQKSGVKPDDLPDTTEFFDGRRVEYIWDEIWWSLVDYYKDNIVCSRWLFYDQEIPYELMVWEWDDEDYDEEAYNNARDEFSKTITYNIDLDCWFIPEWVITSKDFYFNADGQEPFWSLSIRWTQMTRFDPENVKDYYVSTLTKNGNNIHFDWYDIQWDLTKEACIDGGKWDTHEYKIQIVREWDMAYMWCADRYDTDFVIWEEWTLWNFVKKTNYQYKWNSKRDDISYYVYGMINDYMAVWLYQNVEEYYDPTQLLMEKTNNWRKVLYEWSYEVDYDKCEELLQYDNNLMEMFFLVNCPRG